MHLENSIYQIKLAIICFPATIAETMMLFSHIMSKYPEYYKHSAMIPLLDLVQWQHAGRRFAKSHRRGYEVASFYSKLFERSPFGKHLIPLCGTTPAMICGGEDIKQACTDHIGIQNGRTSADCSKSNALWLAPKSSDGRKHWRLLRVFLCGQHQRIAGCLQG